jgi:CRISPR-associated protein Csd1
MILQALVRHYEDLSARGEIASPGWSQGKVSYALYIDDQGQLLRAASVKAEQIKGKKTVLAPQVMDKLPAPVKRTVGIAANFLCDNSSYILGADSKGKPQRALECFAACQALHLQLLSGLESPAAQALTAFFQTWDPARAAEHPALQEDRDEILSGVNLVFRYNGAFVHEDPVICQAWQAHYNSQGDSPKMVCLVTGQKGPVEAVHPAIKGVPGAQSSGAALVSFNAPAFCSYGKEQNLNAPTGQYAAFAYTAALNHLLADRDHVYQMGDTTVVCWAEGGEPAYQSFLGCALFGAPSPYAEKDLRDMVKHLVHGDSVSFDESKLDPDKPFYILGLSPNAARLSVRFFLRNSFGAILENVQAHHERLEIVRPVYDPFETLPLWKLLSETVNQNSKDKSPSPSLAGEVLRAILTNTPYPATLLNGVVLRIRAEHEVTRGRAAILKAYYLKNPNPKDVPEEVLTVSLNPDSSNIPYTLGRMFSVLEAIQSAANPGINATIKDKYFNSASTIPATVFPVLLNLAQKHLRKLKSSNTGLVIFYEKQLSELAETIGDTFPARLNLPQQGSFQLGYYHQTAARYQKKEENNNV